LDRAKNTFNQVLRFDDSKSSDGYNKQIHWLRAKNGTHSGEVLLDFDRVPQARMYGVKWRIDGSEQWKNGTYVPGKKW